MPAAGLAGCVAARSGGWSTRCGGSMSSSCSRRHWRRCSSWVVADQGPRPRARPSWRRGRRSWWCTPRCTGRRGGPSQQVAMTVIGVLLAFAGAAAALGVGTTALAVVVGDRRSRSGVLQSLPGGQHHGGGHGGDRAAHRGRRRTRQSLAGAPAGHGSGDRLRLRGDAAGVASAARPRHGAPGRPGYASALGGLLVDMAAGHRRRRPATERGGGLDRPDPRAGRRRRGRRGDRHVRPRRAGG